MTRNSQPARSFRLESKLARQLLEIKEGQVLPRIREMAEVNQVSVGSISAALAGLESCGAVQILHRGHLGSQVKERSIARLWELAMGEALIISLTLPSNPLYEGLATALKKLISAGGITVYLMFVRGSRARMAALREDRCHVAVMSLFAAEELCGDSEEILLTLPPKSLLSTHKVFYVNSRGSKKPKRVAVDRSSFDQERLTELEFADHAVECRPVSFMQIDWMLKDGHVDAAIWTADDMDRRLGGQVKSRLLSPHVRRDVGDRDSCAAFVASKSSGAVKAFLEATCPPERVLEIQRGVVRGDIIPEY